MNIKCYEIPSNFGKRNDENSMRTRVFRIITSIQIFIGLLSKQRDWVCRSGKKKHIDMVNIAVVGGGGCVCVCVHTRVRKRVCVYLYSGKLVF